MIKLDNWSLLINKRLTVCQAGGAEHSKEQEGKHSAVWQHLETKLESESFSFHLRSSSSSPSSSSFIKLIKFMSSNEDLQLLLKLTFSRVQSRVWPDPVALTYIATSALLITHTRTHINSSLTFLLCRFSHLNNAIVDFLCLKGAWFW